MVYLYIIFMFFILIYCVFITKYTYWTDRTKLTATERDEIEKIVQPQKAKKQLIILGILFVIMGFVVFYTWKTTPPSPKKPPTKETSSVIDLTASVTFTGTQFIIVNKDIFNWTNVKMTINSGTWGTGGFVLSASIMKAGETYTVGALQFAKDDGTRFNPLTFKLKKFTISCDTPKGYAFWVDFWE